ncbi:N-acetylmuramoyl-L-alanine amidase family protein [Slackia heliotrinireducens]|uniref:N-acetylmuramoyl-L-alanine amidase family protein n=1 Tax=Slackia heliotrinireducens TaxID=84110 RepID=UPI003314610A
MSESERSVEVMLRTSVIPPWKNALARQEMRSAPWRAMLATLACMVAIACAVCSAQPREAYAAWEQRTDPTINEYIKSGLNSDGTVDAFVEIDFDDVGYANSNSGLADAYDHRALYVQFCYRSAVSSQDPEYSQEYEAGFCPYYYIPESLLGGTFWIEIEDYSYSRTYVSEPITVNPSGDDGGNLRWSFSPASRTLTISGVGDMTEFEGETPWMGMYHDTDAVVIEDGVTSIGDYAFYGFESLRLVDVPKSVTSIGTRAFWLCGHDLVIRGYAGTEAARFAHDSGRLFDCVDGDLGAMTIDLTAGGVTYDYSSAKKAAPHSTFYSLSWTDLNGDELIDWRPSDTGDDDDGYDLDKDGNVDVTESWKDVRYVTFKKAPACSLEGSVTFKLTPERRYLAAMINPEGYFHSELTVVLSYKQGWNKVDGSWYYMTDAKGTKAKGWKAIGGRWYFFDKSSGAMRTGWLKDGGTYYYLAPAKTSAGDPQGAMLKGWQKVGGKWYYLGTDGKMVTGWKTIGGKQYCFKPSGAMAAGEWYGGWWLSGSGAWTYPYKGSWKQSSKGWWFGDTSGWYAKNQTLKINDKNYTFNSAGYMV